MVCEASNADSMSVRQNSMPIKTEKARAPFMKMVYMMARGTTVAEDWISSDKCTAQSAPMSDAAPDGKPTKKERAWVGQPPSFRKVVKTTDGSL